jgi:hypothetical protein|tara:strand:- start:190 stop:693 length:504 start_codon:yes stop_codon:yes gene_type:complete
MKSKLFKSDKNYILKKIQKESQSSLINFLINKSIKTYDQKTNSIGLLDNISKNIRKFNFSNDKDFIFFYKKISTIYRYNYGEVQLSFLWNGSSHEEFYRKRWKIFFKNEVKVMCENYGFLKTIIYMTVFSKKNKDISELQYNLSTFIRKKFNIQVFKRKGIVIHSNK